MLLSSIPTCDRGNRTLLWSQFCDGIVDCYDQSDEQGHFCKHCVHNLYSCPPQDDIRCDLACQLLDYVPCQMIQDRQACRQIQTNDDHLTAFSWLTEWKFPLAVFLVTLVSLFVLVGSIMCVRYLIHRYQSMKKLNRCDPRTMESDALSSHIYDECGETPSYEIVAKELCKQTYYEYAV